MTVIHNYIFESPDKVAVRSEDSSEGTVSSSVFSSTQGNTREVMRLLSSFIDRNSLLGAGNGTKAL